MKLKISALLLALIIISCGNGQKDVKIPKLDESTAQELMMADFVINNMGNKENLKEIIIEKWREVNED
ncbi:MAG: hypothetical protein ACOCZW_03165 [Bacteroidota bacterium]